jgi:NTP pyrophosphatase (non-canonical NTP hydrolase)
MLAEMMKADEKRLEAFRTGENNNLTELSKKIYNNNFDVGWWTELDERALAESQSLGNRYSKDMATLIASKLALVHSEVSEALEGMRKGLMDDHLPERSMVEVELADAVIRICDLAGFLGLDLGGAVTDKLAYNAKRLDHQLSVRAAEGGKTI